MTRCAQQAGGLEPGERAANLGDPVGAVDAGAGGLQRQEEPEVDALPGDDGADEAGAAAALSGGEDEHADVAVGVAGDVVGGGVVAVVLLAPPRVAHADQDVADDQRGGGDVAARAEDLLVRDVVGEQAELGGEHAEGEGGGEDEDDAVGEEGDGQDAGEAGGRHGGLAHVVAGLGVEAADGL